MSRRGATGCDTLQTGCATDRDDLQRGPSPPSAPYTNALSHESSSCQISWAHPRERHPVIPANYHDLLVTTEHENTPCRTFSELFLSVIPAEVGIQKSWIPVFTGMTELAAAGRNPPGYFQVKDGIQAFQSRVPRWTYGPRRLPRTTIRGSPG